MQHVLENYFCIVLHSYTYFTFSAETENNTSGNVDENRCEYVKQPHRNCKYHDGLIKLQPDEKKKIVENCGGDTVFGGNLKVITIM